MNANARHQRVLRLRREGKTFREIGEHLGVSAGRARQVHESAERMERLQPERRWLEGLSQRTISVLARAKLYTREDVEKAVREGRLSWSNKMRDPGYIRDYGKKTHAEVLQWLGMSVNANDADKETIARYIAYLERQGYRVTPPGER